LHTRLMYKLKLSLPLNYFLILKSYLQNRHFLVKIENERTCPINAGIPQGSVLRQLLNKTKYQKSRALCYVYVCHIHEVLASNFCMETVCHN
jgi:hypothetical protein